MKRTFRKQQNCDNPECKKPIGFATYVVKIGDKVLNACSAECREVLEGSNIKKGVSMKKDDAKKKPVKKAAKEVEVEEVDAEETEVDADEEEVDADEEEVDADEDTETDEVEEVEEEEPAPKKTGKKTAAPAAPAKATPKKKSGKPAPYAYREGSTTAKLFAKLADGKLHQKDELLKKFTNGEIVLKGLKRHAGLFGWDWSENKSGQIKLVVPKADKAIALGQTTE